MANLALYDKKGKKSSKDQAISDELFGQEPNEHLLYLAKIRQESNARRGTANTKSRHEVRGGGAKPWRQKGTGRARAGSSNSPLWRGGGVMHGPLKTVNWKKGMNDKESVRALLAALQLANKDSRLVAIEELSLSEAKTKELAAIVKATDLNGNILFVVDSANAQLPELERASRNLVKVKVISNSRLNVNDLLKADSVIASSKALAELEERFAGIGSKKVAA